MNNIWTKEETIIAFNVFCKIPFKKSSKSNPLIIHYAELLGRTPDALNMKIGNIGRLDPDLKNQGIVGLAHGAKMEKEVWDEFYGNPERLAYESEQLIAKLSKQNIETSSMIDTKDLPQGEERNVVVKQRVNQSFFRASVMSAYNFCCCISGVGTPELLEACHIVDWSKDIANRTNPKNGLCLNSFFHKAYDKNLIAISPDLDIFVSEKMIQNTHELNFQKYLQGLKGNKISIPDRFLPDRDLLNVHYEQFKKNIT